MDLEIIQADARAIGLRDQSVQMCVTSPPYYGLRDYEISGQIGLENTLQEYIENLVMVFREVWRVMKDDGTLWLNLGDTYGNDKQIMGVPWRVAFALQADGWYLRQDIIWQKPNPMPESIKDRCTKAHEYIFLLFKQPKYYYDYQAILEAANYDGRKDTIYKGSQKFYQSEHGQGSQDPGRGERTRWPNQIRGFKTKDQIQDNQHHGNDIKGYGLSGNGFKGHSGNYDAEGNLLSHSIDGIPARNKRSVWTVPAKPYSGAHFATFPPDLIIDCIKAGSRENDMVLDPFNGSGTTGEVCARLKRNYVGLELNRKYILLSNERLKPFRIQPSLI